MLTLFTLDLTCNKEHALKLVERTLNISESFIFGRSSKLGVQISTEDPLLLILTLNLLRANMKNYFKIFRSLLKNEPKNHQPVSHRVPRYPSGQSHLNPLTRSRHDPPLWHGLALQSSTSAIPIVIGLAEHNSLPYVSLQYFVGE